jgi:hypothetical protein
MLLTDYEINGKTSVESVRLSIRHLRDFIGLDRALDLTADRITKCLRERQKEGAANGSNNRELAVLKRALTLATRAATLGSSPYIALLEENNSRRGFLNHGGFLALLGGLPNHRKDPILFVPFRMAMANRLVISEKLGRLRLGRPVLLEISFMICAGPRFVTWSALEPRSELRWN